MFEDPNWSRLNGTLSRLSRRLARALLALDARFDSSLHAMAERTGAHYATLAAWMDRLHVSGWRRLAIEFFCEGANLTAAFGICALITAAPAFRDTAGKDWLKKQNLAVTFLDRYGRVVGRRGIKADNSVPLDQMPKYMIQAVISTEDRRFFEHFGIDFLGTLRALTVNARADTIVQGGSSITQQLAKNLFLTDRRTLSRKIKEAYLAFWLEGHLTKRQILQLYLDRMYMGGGTFGVEAASEYYFGRSVRNITLAQAAMLAGLFKAPSKFAPDANLPAARARAAAVLQNMVAAGYLTEGQIFGALHNPATPIAHSSDAAPNWYLDWAYDEVRKLAAAHKLGGARVLTVRTALDPNLQKFADAAIDNQLRQYGHAYHVDEAALVVLDPSTGAVRAIVGGRDYGASQFDRAVDALRQPGSSFKPFDFLTALMTGKYKPSSVVLDGPICIGNWCPHNYGNEYLGRVTLTTALEHSLNSVAVRLSVLIGDAYPVKGHNNTYAAAKRGRAKIVQTARRMGITTPLPDTVSLPIGADGVSVMEMTGAYATFANGGLKVSPYAVVEATDSKGNVVYRHDRDTPPPKRIYSKKVIIQMVSMMKAVVRGGTGRRAKLDNIDAAGKTGTTNGYKDAWFMGYTGNYVCGVWFGNDDDTPTNRMVGGSLPAMTWHEVMTYAHQGIELKPLPGDPPPAVKTAPPAPQAADLGIPRRPPSLSPASVSVLDTIAKAAQTAESRRTAQDDGPILTAQP